MARSWGVKRQANAVDFWRGFALISIFVNHIPGIFYEKFTHKNFSISDSADLFVFLAGWALFLAAGRCASTTPPGQIFSRLGARALKIYGAQIFISSLAIAMLAAAAHILENPLLLEWHNAASMFYDPANAHIGLVLLTYHLGYFDILPLYVALMLMAPVIILIHRVAPNWLLPVSLALYLLVLAFRITIPSWPTAGYWFFNPLAWQLVFVLGFTMARQDGLGGFVRAHIHQIRVAAIPFVIMGAVMVQFNWWPDPTLVPKPVLFFVATKSYATPIRMIQFLSLVALVSAAYPAISRASPQLNLFLSKLGRNSLNVFCVASLASLFGQIMRFVYQDGFLVDTLMLVIGVSLLGLTAWVSEWSKSGKRG
jgi:hypothetical protein